MTTLRPVTGSSRRSYWPAGTIQVRSAAARIHAVSSASGWGSCRRRVNAALLRDLEVLDVHVEIVGDADPGVAVDRLQLAVADEVRLLDRRHARAVDAAVHGVPLHAHRHRLRHGFTLARRLVRG